MLIAARSTSACRQLSTPDRSTTNPCNNRFKIQNMKTQNIPSIALFALTACLLAGTAAHAGVNVIVRQVGNDVVITGGGRLNTAAWNLAGEDIESNPYLSDGGLNLGAPALIDMYDTPTNFTGPSQFSAGFQGGPALGFGALFGIETESGVLVVPAGYGSNLDLQFCSVTFSNQTIADLAFTADKLHWSWEDGSANIDFFNIVVNRPRPGNITYQITADPGLDSGWGYSGTVTTDGTLGTFSMGQPLPIIDWSITLTTPGGDGVSTRTLTPLNSYLYMTPNPLGTQFTETQIILPLGGGSIFFSNFSDGSEEVLRVYGSEDGEGGGINVLDLNESPGGSGWKESTPADFVFATAIAHPSLRIDGVVPAGASLSWDSTAGREYGLYSSSNLIDWVAVPDFNRIPETAPTNTTSGVPLPAAATGFFFLGAPTGE